MKFKTDKFSYEDVIRNETLFTTANGNIGMRGDTEEKAYSYHKGTYINGFYDTEPIQYGETAYGYAENHETILNLPDPKRIELTINGNPFEMDPRFVTDFTLELDTETGILTRNVHWSKADMLFVKLTTSRLVSFVRQNCAFIEYRVKNEGKEAINITIRSSIDTKVRNVMAEEDPRIGAKFSSPPLLLDKDRAIDEGLYFTARTRHSGLCITGSIAHTAQCSDRSVSNIQTNGTCCGGIVYSIKLQPNETFLLTKYIVYVHGKTEDSDRIERQAENECIRLKTDGTTIVKQEQKNYLSNFWDTARITIEGDVSSEDALTYNLFQLLQSAGKDGTESIAAKGLTGEGYEGHFFWDTESYVCPVFTYTAPHIAESLLAYRAAILPEAKKHAATMSMNGALYPWRTISGEEASAYFPAGTAQYHIDADIVFALNRYLTEQGFFSEDSQADKHSDKDRTKRTKTGLTKAAIKEIAAETARMWMSLGFFNTTKDGKFCINEVTGPDEYTALVNNNAYTNLMARENLYISCKLAGDYVSKEEKDGWRKAADAMFIPYDDKLGIYPQDDSFLDKQTWDFTNTPTDSYPLLLHYHPLVIYRYRVLKQPDLVLAQFLLSGLFSRTEKIRNFNFYEQYTTGDSSLSQCIQSIMANEIGDTKKAFSYFEKTVRMDIDDINGNVRDGIHTASMAGSWMAVIYGFAGFRDYNGIWTFNPQLPDKWKKLLFNLRLEGHTLSVCLTRNKAVYALRDKKTDNPAPLTIIHRNKAYTLDPSISKNDTKEIDLTPQLNAVLFDLDGVITDTAELHFKAWQTVAQKYNLKFTRETNKLLLGISREASLDIILRENDIVWSDKQKKTVCKEKNDLYVKLLETLTPTDILPGIRDLLQNLKTAGIKTAVASSSKNAVTVIRKLGLIDMFTTIPDISSVQMPKPEPDIFIAAAEQTGTWYTDCIAIEDAEAGIAAIRKAGMKSIGVCTKDFLATADVKVKNTSEITLDLLKKTIMDSK